jgi:mRNA-degrading endonuclease RelE of RelBE toxin-antitoxin system
MKIFISRNFEKDLNKLSDHNVKKIYTKVNELASNQENLNIKKLKAGNEFRLRIGDYRIIFEYRSIKDETVILLLNVFHRKDAYKK